MIFQLIYESTAREFMSQDDLLDLLQVSRENNQRAGITGMLLYDRGRFLQLLEGGEAAVLERFDVIAQDERHHWVSLLMKGPNDARDFPEWSMAFRDVSRQQPRVEGWSGFLDDASASVAPATSYVRDIFHRFRDNAELDVEG